jgi:hypothetical protein
VARLVTSPLKVIAEKLTEALDEAECAFKAGSLPLNKLTELATYVSHIVSQLPQSFGERFFFDSAMIRCMAEDWSGSLTISPMIIPWYGLPWGHLSLPVPSRGGKDTHLIDVICFRGADRLGDINLLEYPWVAHELGHYVLFRDDSPFTLAFLPALQSRMRSLELLAIADRGAARVKADKTIEELRRFWTPSPDHKNWAHELAVDMIGLWTCGPAYLATFEDEVGSPQTDPYAITQDHPPYEVRLRALVGASHHLGFGKHAEGLIAISKAWARSTWCEGENNRFLGLADKDLIGDCRESAFRACESLNLRRWATSRFEAARRELVDENSMDLGVDLLLSARIVFQEQGESALDNWETSKVRRVAEYVMP